MTKPSYVPPYYRLPNSDKEYLCSTNKDNGLHRCHDLPALRQADLTKVCQNSLPLNWRPPKQPPKNSQASSKNDSRFPYWRPEDRFVDGDLVPYDLVPGDEASPFLVKQLSPLIAQSVFQPAFAPRHIDSLPSMRQRREVDSESRGALLETSTNNPLRSSAGRLLAPEVTSTRNARKSVGFKLVPTRPSAQQNYFRNNSFRSKNKQSSQLESDGKQQKSKSRVARQSDQERLFRKSTTFDDNENEPIVGADATSEKFDSISRNSYDSKPALRRHKKANKGSCINWNNYYTECRAGESNPFQGTISFDNVGMAWTAIFLVISLEGWSDIMYLLQDSHSFWVWTYFVLLIVIGSFFMINLCLVVIATQFSATKKREMERMRQERLKFSSSSTLTATSESTNCYTVIVKTIAHYLRRAKISFIDCLKRRKCRRLRNKRLGERLQQQQQESASSGVCSQAKLSSSSASGGGACPKSADSESINLGGPHQQQQQSVLSPEQLRVNAAARRNSWKKSSKSFGVRQQLETISPLDESQGELEYNGELSGDNEALRQEEANKRSIRLRGGAKLRDASDNGGNCSAQIGTRCASTRRSTRRGKAGSFKQRHANCLYCDGANIKISFCPSFIKRNRKFKSFRREFNEKVKRLVDHRYFQRLILLAILINAISMGIEYHNQPIELTEAVEICNIVFAFLFLVEMILKLIAHGLYDYVIDGFNCFDGCIVIISILELFSSTSGGSGLSVLRTFRLLRILKLVRFMPALRRQLVIMLRTLDNVAVFFALLVLFIFIFSILGMNLFGCKFCETLPDGTERCDRKNFNSLLWSLVTVFQILTQEDWNVSTEWTELRDAYDQLSFALVHLIDLHCFY